MTKENSLKQPAKKERLAKKQEERIRRIAHLRSRLSEFSPQWWVGIGEILGLAVLFWMSFWLLAPFFGLENKTNVFSAPVIPVLATLTESLVPFPYGVRLWLLIFLIFFPLSYYFFVKGIAGRRLTAFLASFLVILPLGVFLLARVELGILGEDGAHIASLTLTPVVCLLLLRFLRTGRFWIGILAALGTTLVALTSPIGLLVLTVFMGAITFSEMLLGSGRLKFLRFVLVILLVVGFSAFWYNPKFAFLTIQSSQGQLVKKTLANLLPVSFFLLPLLGIAGFLLFENQPQLQAMFIAFFLTIGFGLFSLGAGMAHPAPSRFIPAFGISLSFLIGVVVVALFDFLRTSPRVKRFKPIYFYRRLISFGLIGAIFVLLFILFIVFSQNFWEIQYGQVLGLTAEQKVGIWEIKEGINRAENVFGYAVTGLAVLSVVILKLRLKEKE